MVRKRQIIGTKERPRLSVYRSLRHLHAQIIDDLEGKTLVEATTAKKGMVKYGGNVAAAKTIGKLMAEKALALGIRKIVFDRGRFSYHGRIKALAETAKEGGLEF